MQNWEVIFKNVENNNMKSYFVERKEDVIPLLETIMEEGCTVASGGSMSLKETGVTDYLKSGRFKFLDRNAEGISREEAEKIQREAFFADVFMCSTNAITEAGVLYNVDGFANRVSAMLYGPKSVILVVGKNKIVKDLDAAVKRIKTVTAPKNCVRLSCETFCREEGKCISMIQENPEIASGCSSDRRICCDYVIMARQRIKDRIKIIFVNEDLGF